MTDLNNIFQRTERLEQIMADIFHQIEAGNVTDPEAVKRLWARYDRLEARVADLNAEADAIVLARRNR